MPTFHARLALEYFQARPRHERTTATLSDICTQLSLSYALSAASETAILAEALHLAKQRGLLHDEEKP